MEILLIILIVSGALLVSFLLFIFLKGINNSNNQKLEYENEKSEVKRKLEDYLLNSRDIDDRKNKNILFQAIYYNFDDVALNIISKGVDVENTNEKGETALILASKTGHFNVVKALIDLNAQVNSVDKNHVSALWAAAGNGFKDIVEILLQNEAKIDKRDAIWGMTPLMRAVQAGKYEVAKLILKFHPDMEIRAFNGDSALDFARNAVDKYWEVFKADNAELRKMVTKIEEATFPQRLTKTEVLSQKKSVKGQ